MIQIKSPDVCIGIVYEKISKPERTAFVSAILVGFLTHLYAFTNKLYNYDEAYSTPGNYGVGIENNRWLLEYLGRMTGKILGGSYSLPLLNGTLSILFLALSALLVVRMFEVKSKLFAGIAGGLMVAFPAVTCMFFFMFTAVYYSLAIFLSILAAYLLVRHEKKWLLNLCAAVLLACSLGIYQAYFPNTVCLCLMSVIFSLAFGDEKEPFHAVLYRGIRYVITLAAGMALYFVLNRAFHRYWNVAFMGNYQGLNTMGQLTLADLKQGIVNSYHSFAALCYEQTLYLNTIVSMMKSYFCIMLLLAGSVLFLLCAKKGNWAKKVLMVLCFLLLPMAFFLIYIMAPEAYVYTLMIYPLVFLLIFFLIWTERLAHEISGRQVASSLLQWAAIGLSGFVLFIYVWYGNGCYMSMEYTKYHDLAYFETMVTQIKSLEGYRDDMEVVIVGQEIEDETNQIGSLLGNVFGMEGKSESNVNAYSRNHIIAKYLGFVPQFGGYEDILTWMDREEVKEMNCYPDDGSIQIIDDTIIVKLSD
jgi:hypothetical protein